MLGFDTISQRYPNIYGKYCRHTYVSVNVITTTGVSVEFSKQIVVAYRVWFVNIGIRRRKRVWAVTSSCLSFRTSNKLSFMQAPRPTRNEVLEIKIKTLKNKIFIYLHYQINGFLDCFFFISLVK